MAIDGISKLPQPPAAPPEGPSQPATEAREAFPGVRNPPAETAPPLPVPGGALDRLRSGEIDLRGYLDMKVDEATAHLRHLPVRALDNVRAALRDRLASDPCLSELLRTATAGPGLPRED